MVKQALNQNNLGARVVTRTYSWLDAVIRSWGSQFYEPDHRIYEFRSQNYDSTDMNATGIYGITEASVLGLPGVAGSYASTNGVNVQGDISIAVYAAASNWTASTFQVLIGKWNDPTTPQEISFQVFIVATTGVISLQITMDDTGGTLTRGDSTVAPSINNGQGIWVGLSRSATTGDIKFYTSTNSPSTPIGQVSWSQLGTTVNKTAGNIFGGTANLIVGANNGGSGSVFGGSVSAAYVFSGLISGGIGGSLISSMVPSDTWAGSEGWTSVLTGEQWTLNGNAAVS